MKKQIKNFILILALILLVPGCTFARNNISLFVNGNEVASDVAPFIENSRTLVPVRIISENLGYKVAWDAKNAIVTINGNNKIIKMPINSTKVAVNGNTVNLDTAAKIKSGRTFVPVRFIAETFGTEVNWDNNTRSVYVGKKSISSNTFEEVKVTRVIDGDTIIVNLNGRNERLRMILVDTPETVHPNKPVQCFGKEASNYTKAQLTDKTVYLQKDVSDRDRYSRILRYVWLKRPATNEPTKAEIEQYMYNAILVKEGYGRIATFPPDIKYVDIFRELDRNARLNNVGMWGCSEYKNEKNNIDTKSDIPAVNNTASAQNPQPSGKIKGNKNSKIYHVPGGKSYNKISENNVVYFDTEQDAINAGYRKAKN